MLMIMFGLAVFFAGLTLWLGLYLIQREGADGRLRWVGGVLVVYAAATAGLAAAESPWTWLLLGIGSILWVLDLALAYRGVVAAGEAFWPDALRSLVAAALAAILFGLPVAVTVGATTGALPALRLLLLVIVALAIGSQVLAEPLQRVLDRIVFRAQPALQQTRADLRATAETLPRVADQLDPLGLDEAEFVRLTRRALSCYGDLPRLSASPLTRLSTIDSRLTGQTSAVTTLARATELQRLLLEAIQRLKPPGEEDDFCAADAWRHYNALYYPYVTGLKPYSYRAHHDHLDPKSQRALEWFRSQVPERTLHNWQNAAAVLVAQYLREAGQSS
ncbi:MAG: hypothetical protein DCC55_26120 [Chloroflexi bacterium]|nr:MAG: hypothetical protein DCC55_26120 [Chloroflexota bacterium]